MDTNELSGIVDAIEEESKQPSPSHANLSRLVAMFFRKIVSTIEKMDNPVTVTSHTYTDLAGGTSQHVFNSEEHDPLESGHPKRGKSKRSK